MNNKLAIVILSYNDNKDLFQLLPLLEKQRYDFTVIIVDNASNIENKKQTSDWIKAKESYYIGEKVTYYENRFERDKKYYLVYNDWNAGFSAGNNVGFKVAYLLGMKYALLVNPDVRIYEENYLEVLVREISAHPNAVVAGSNILDLEGESQSPSRLGTFSEEFLWFLPWVAHKKRVLDIQQKSELENATIHGCCMMFDINFLNEVGYLDENVFMYSEEPILAARVKRAGKKMIYVPEITAVHAHIRVKKLNASLRMQDFFKSRKYYIREYSDYTKIQKILVSVSYKVCSIMHRIKYKWNMKGKRG